MHNCLACSSFETSKQRRRKKTSTRYNTRCRSTIETAPSYKNNSPVMNKTKEINLELLEFQLNSEPSVILDQTIVKKFMKAKRVIDEILRSGESKSDITKTHSNEYPSLNLNSCDESFDEVYIEISRKNSTETALTTDTLESCENNVPTSNLWIKDESLDRESYITIYNDENLLDDPQVQFVEIPFNSNIVLNPMNNRFSFSQVDPILINNNNDDVTNGNMPNSEQINGPKYLYNPMNNIVTLTQTNDDSDEHNNNPPDVMPADVQFSPGEYSMEDSLMNEFALEPTDMEPNQSVLPLTQQSYNQNILPLIEESSKEQDLPMQLVNTVLSPGTESDETVSPKYDQGDNSNALIESVPKEQEIISYNEMEYKQEVTNDIEENACFKCHKKFKFQNSLRKHELTCGITFHYNCLFCAKTSLLSHTIKCHMTNRHVKEVAIYGIKGIMETVIKRRKENKVTNMNILLSQGIQALANVESSFLPINKLENTEKNDKRKQTLAKARGHYNVEIKKELLEENCQEEFFPKLQSTDVHSDEPNFKPSKQYVDALCSNCNVYVKNLKSGMIKCCPSCQSPLIYKCAVCRKCFSKYLSICGHVKYHTKPDMNPAMASDDKHYCGYCNYKTIQKSQLLRHILSHIREKSVKIKHEYSG